MVIKEAPKDHPGIPDVPRIRAIDGSGRPAPWADGPNLEIRVMPPGPLGEITWHDSTVPFFSRRDLQGMGHGVVHIVDKGGPDKGKCDLIGPISYLSFDRGKGDAITVDVVNGTLDKTTEVLGTRWGHVEAVPVAEGVAHAFRQKRPQKPVANEHGDAGAPPAP